MCGPPEQSHGALVFALNLVDALQPDDCLLSKLSVYNTGKLLRLKLQCFTDTVYTLKHSGTAIRTRTQQNVMILVRSSSVMHAHKNSSGAVQIGEHSVYDFMLHSDGGDGEELAERLFRGGGRRNIWNVC